MADHPRGLGGAAADPAASIADIRSGNRTGLISVGPATATGFDRLVKLTAHKRYIGTGYGAAAVGVALQYDDLEITIPG